MGYLDLSRNILQKVILNNETIIDGFVKAQIEQSGSTKSLSIGDFITSQITLTYRGEAKAWDNARFQLLCSIDDGNNVIDTSVGYYYVNTVSYDGYKYEIKGYDFVPKFLDVFVDEGHTNSLDIVNDILTYTGMSLASGTTFSSFEIEKLPENATYKSLLGYIAGYDGSNLKINENGEIEKFWYTSSGIRISRDVQFQNQLVKDSKEITISSVRCGEYSAGSGFGIVFTNPYITQAQVNAIYNVVNGMNYIVADVKFRGDPNIRIGDMVQVETTENVYKNVPIMECEYVFDGGMNQTIHSFEKEAETFVLNVSPIEKKIKDSTETLIEQVMSVLLGDTEGYFNFIDSSGNIVVYGDGSTIAGWQITDSASVSATTKGWRFLQGGLYFSEDGFQTLKNIAITNTGKIICDAIAGGTLTLGGINNDNGVLEILDANGKVIGKWDNSGIEVIGGKIVSGEFVCKVNADYDYDLGTYDTKLYNVVRNVKAGTGTQLAAATIDGAAFDIDTAEFIANSTNVVSISRGTTNHIYSSIMLFDGWYITPSVSTPTLNITGPNTNQGYYFEGDSTYTNGVNSSGQIYNVSSAGYRNLPDCDDSVSFWTSLASGTYWVAPGATSLRTNIPFNYGFIKVDRTGNETHILGLATGGSTVYKKWCNSTTSSSWSKVSVNTIQDGTSSITWGSILNRNWGSGLYLLGNGMVQFRLNATWKANTNGDTLCTLPVGYRPTTEIVQNVKQNGTLNTDSYIQITTAGLVKIYGMTAASGVRQMFTFYAG